MSEKRAKLLRAIERETPKAQPVVDVGGGGALMAPGSPEWLDARRTGLGGSDIAAALGLSPWMSPYELYLDKLGELPPRPDTEAMAWGRLLEPLILHRYCERTHLRLSRPRMLRSERFPWLIANVDGIGLPPEGAYAPVAGRVVEAKNARARGDAWGEPGSPDVPTQYLLQGQSYLIVTKLQLCDIVVLFGGADLQIYTLHADRELQQMIIEGTREFWQHVMDQRPPPIEGIEDARRRWGKIAAKGIVTATPEDLRLVAQLRESMADAKVLKGDIEDAQAQLMARLGDSGDTLVHPDTKRPLLTWKLAAGAQRFNLDRFKEDQPALYAKYCAAGEGVRRFLLKESHE